MTNTEKGRARQAALWDLLEAYPVASTEQLANLLWRGDARLARKHLLRYYRERVLDRRTHPLVRQRMLYSKAGRRNLNSQKVLHSLAELELHVAVVRSFGPKTVRVVPEMPWSPSLIPDQTVILCSPLSGQRVWAVEHHLSGQFTHASQYQQVIDEEAYLDAPWWNQGTALEGLLVLTTPHQVDAVRGRLALHRLDGLLWRVGTVDAVLRDPVAWFTTERGIRR